MTAATWLAFERFLGIRRFALVARTAIPKANRVSAAPADFVEERFGPALANGFRVFAPYRDVACLAPANATAKQRVKSAEKSMIVCKPGLAESIRWQRPVVF